MRRTIALYVEPDVDLVQTIKVVNSITNDTLKVGFAHKEVNKTRLHHLTYYPMREKYPTAPSSLVTTARDMASAMLKLDKCKVLPVKRPHSAIRYNARTITVKLRKGFISLSTVQGRKHINVIIPKCFSKYLDWKVQAATVRYCGRTKKVVVSLCVEERTPAIRPPVTVLGLDTGILNHAVLSNNKFFKSNRIRGVKGRYQHLRRQLQAKGTRSAKRHLRRLRGREQRFMADINHGVANWIVSQPFDAIAMEKLNIQRSKKLGKRFNRALGSWAFGQLQEFVIYKAESIAKPVYRIDARYTSQRCSKCGAVHKESRQGLRYKCAQCGLELHADLNAARNIAELGKSELSRLPVNEPIVAGSDTEHRTSVEPSYKPTSSLVGN